MSNVPVIVGGIIPESDQETLKRQGVARIYTPGSATLTQIIGDIVDIVAERLDRAA
jgi:(2R)-ethylmalonyl-CoA mutase